MFNHNVLKALQLRPIAPDEANLTPKLRKYNRTLFFRFILPQSLQINY
jgi:hypothetical protein